MRDQCPLHESLSPNNLTHSNEKFDFFDHLPPELKVEITNYLSPSDLIKLIKTSMRHWTFFQPLADVFKILHYVVLGEQSAVRLLLQKDPNLIFKRSCVRDCSGRIFENISAFEYALWALDESMWTTMLTCISEIKESTHLFTTLLAQYTKVDARGITYKLNGLSITEKHFDFQNTIIKELKKQINAIRAPGEKNWDHIDKQWREGVGGAQNLLPMHVVYEYCSDLPFDPLKFSPSQKVSKQFYNWITQENDIWYDINSKLGIDFAIFKGFSDFDAGNPGGAPQLVPRWTGVRVLGLDCVALTRLYKIRTQGYTALKSLLIKQAEVNFLPTSIQVI